MKKLIYAIASVTAIAANIDAASAVSLTQGAGNGNNLYDDYVEQPKSKAPQEVLVASVEPVMIEVAPAIELNQPESQNYEYQAIEGSRSPKQAAIAAPKNSSGAVAKSVPNPAPLKRQVPEPSIVMGMLAIAGAAAALRRKGEASGEQPLS